MATWCEELTPWKRPWCWERLKVGGEGNNRGWDGWMASPTEWTWVWVSSGSWWWAGKPGVLQSMGSKRVRHGWATELIDTYIYITYIYSIQLNVFISDSTYLNFLIGPWLEYNHGQKNNKILEKVKISQPEKLLL